MKKITILLLSLLLFHGCSEEDSSRNTNNDNYIVYTEPLNPLLFSKELSSNETIEVYGVRDTNGLPISINNMILRNSSGEETTYTLDETGKLSYLKAYDGTVLKLDWQDNLINLTVIGSSKESYFKTTVDLNNPTGRFTSQTNNNTQVFNQNPNENIQVNVIRCGELAEYEGIVKVETDFGAYDVTNKFSVLSKSDIGVYNGQVNNPLLPPLTGEDVCSAIGSLTEIICAAYDINPATSAYGNAICTQIGIYISATGAVPVGVGVGSLCAAVNTFFSIACDFVGICNVAEFQDFSFTNQELPIRAVLSGPDGNYFSDWVTVNFTQELPTIEVNLGDSYSHLVEITAPNLNCESDWQAYIDNINLGTISTNFPVYTTISNGEHTVYLKNGIQFTENWDDPISFPCEGSEAEVNFSFDVECNNNTDIDIVGIWTMIDNGITCQDNSSGWGTTSSIEFYGDNTYRFYPIAGNSAFYIGTYTLSGNQLEFEHSVTQNNIYNCSDGTTLNSTYNQVTGFNGTFDGVNFNGTFSYSTTNTPNLFDCLGSNNESCQGPVTLSQNSEGNNDILQILTSRNWIFLPNNFPVSYTCYDNQGNLTSNGSGNNGGPSTSIVFNSNYTVSTSAITSCNPGTGNFTISGSSISFDLNIECTNSNSSWSFNGTYDEASDKFIGTGITNTTSYHSNGEIECDYVGSSTSINLE
ncbi:hypothetical protein ACU8DI_14855 [Psychroserpens sp. BH13MA-6]